MTSKYFDKAITVEQVRVRYRDLCLVHNPARGGDASIMQAINEEYLALLKTLHGASAGRDSEGREHTYYFNADREQALVDKVNEVLGFKLAGVEIMIVGTWLWCAGDTRPHASVFKGLGFRYVARRQRWAWHEGRYKGKFSKEGFRHLMDKYGYEEVQSASGNKRAA